MNMAYCRFQNTLADLQDCDAHLEETDTLSDEERQARLRLIRLAVSIALEYGDDVGRPCTRQ
jgi:hypothetical protein